MRRSSAYADLQMFVTCFFMVVLDEIVIPRFLLWVTNGMSELPAGIELGAESGNMILSDWSRIDSASSSFSFSLSQSSHNFTSEMQFCMRWTVVFKWSGWQESRSWVSSAKDWLETEWRSIKFESGFVYKMDKRGPRTEPRGTPKQRIDGFSCRRWSLFESFKEDKTQTTIEQCWKYHGDFKVWRVKFCDQWCRMQLTSPRELVSWCFEPSQPQRITLGMIQES